MENLFTIILTVVVMIVIFELIIRKIRGKKKAKPLLLFRFLSIIMNPAMRIMRRWRPVILKGLGILLITGIFWVPVTLIYSIKHPEHAAVYVARMGFVGLSIKHDVRSTYNRVDKKLTKTLEPYTPKVAKKVVRWMKRAYNRYGIRDTQHYVAEAGKEVGLNLPKPQESLFIRAGRGVINVGTGIIKGFFGGVYGILKAITGAFS
jgi:hypothetical protein